MHMTLYALVLPQTVILELTFLPSFSYTFSLSPSYNLYIRPYVPFHTSMYIFVHSCPIPYIMYTSLHLCLILCNNVSFQTFITNRIIIVQLYYTSFTFHIYTSWEHNTCLDTCRTPIDMSRHTYLGDNQDASMASCICTRRRLRKGPGKAVERTNGREGMTLRPP